MKKELNKPIAISLMEIAGYTVKSDKPMRVKPTEKLCNKIFDQLSSDFKMNPFWEEQYMKDWREDLTLYDTRRKEYKVEKCALKDSLSKRDKAYKTTYTVTRSHYNAVKSYCQGNVWATENAKAVEIGDKL